MFTTLLLAPLLIEVVKTKVPAGSECNAPCGFFMQNQEKIIVSCSCKFARKCP